MGHSEFFRKKFKPDKQITKLPCYMTVIEGLSALLGYYNYPKALALGLDYVDSVYRISESYVLAGLLYALNCFI